MVHQNLLIHDAAASGDQALLAQALELNQRLDTPNSEGLTPLHIAIKTRNNEILSQLCRHGASINLADYSAKRNFPLH